VLSKWKNQYWGKFTVLKEVPKTSGKKSTNLLISSNDSSEKDSIEDNSYKSGNNRNDDKGPTQEGENEVEESTKDLSDQDNNYLVTKIVTFLHLYKIK